MASKLGDLYVQVSSKGVTQVNTGLQQTEKRANLAANAANMLKTAIIGLGAYGVLRIFKYIMNEYMTQEKALAKLTQQLKNHNELTQDNVDALTAQAEALQKVTMFADDQIIAAQAMLASFNLTTEQLLAMTPRLLDVATMTENTTGSMQDLATTAKMVGVALSGQPGRLAQMGIKLSEYEKKLYNAANEQEKFNLLLQIFDNNAQGLAVAVGKTLSGNLAILKNRVNELAEAFATELVPTIRDFLDLADLLLDGFEKLKPGYEFLRRWSSLSFTDPIMQIKMFGEVFRRLGISVDRTKESLTGFHNLMGKFELPPAPETEITEAMQKDYREMIDLREAMANRIGDESDATEKLIQLYELQLEVQAILQAKADEEEAERQRAVDLLWQQANVISSYLAPTLYSLYGALVAGGNVWKNFANAAIDALKRIMVQMMAMATLAGILNVLFPGLGGFGSVFKSLMGFGKLYQTPGGDWFAQKEGRDFGKFFMDGFQTSFMPMLAGVNTSRQPMNVIVHTGDPSTYVEFVSNLPPQYKSKIYRDVTRKGAKLEA